MRCTVVGTMDDVVKAAARFNVVDLTSHEPTLEDIFLTFYGSDAEDDVTITAKTLRDQRRALIGWSIGVAALVLLYASFYPSIKANAAQLDKYFESLPEALRNAIGTGTISSPVGYLRSEIFSTMGPLLLLILAIGAGARAIAGEEERKTLDLLLANPVTRRTVVMQKFWAMVGSTAGVGLVLVAAIAVFGPAFGLHVALIDILAASVSAVALAVSFGDGRARGRLLARESWRRHRGGHDPGGRELLAQRPGAQRLVHRAAPGPFALLPLHRPRSAPNGLQPPHLLVLIAISAVALILAVVASIDATSRPERPGQIANGSYPGAASGHGLAASHTSPRFRTRSSRNRGPVIWRPNGMPFGQTPAGTVKDGCPVMFVSAVL